MENNIPADGQNETPGTGDNSANNNTPVVPAKKIDWVKWIIIGAIVLVLLIVVWKIGSWAFSGGSNLKGTTTAAHDASNQNTNTANDTTAPTAGGGTTATVPSSNGSNPTNTTGNTTPGTTKRTTDTTETAKLVNITNQPAVSGVQNPITSQIPVGKTIVIIGKTANGHFVETTAGWMSVTGTTGTLLVDVPVSSKVYTNAPMQSPSANGHDNGGNTTQHSVARGEE